MEEVSKSGRTILFVSHDLTAIRALTAKCVLLQGGRNVAFDSTPIIIERYLDAQADTVSNLDVKGKTSKIHSARLVNSKGEHSSTYTIDFDFMLEFTFSKEQENQLSFEVFLKDELQNKIAMFSFHHFNNELLPKGVGKYTCSVSLAKLNLASGRYFIDIVLSQPKIGWDVYAENAITFDVLMCNPNNFSWDLKQEYRYGNIAWMSAGLPKIVANDREE
jgi:lipopolysaccharide transport system ATP-binding protein